MDENNYEIYEAKYKPVYGENWQIMISRKIQKEIDVKNGIDSEKSPLGEFFEAYNDIEGDVFAAKRNLAKNAENSAKMPKENLTQGEKMEQKQEIISFATQGTQRTTDLRQKAKAVIQKLVDGKVKIKNKKDGRVAQISSQGRNEMLSGRALKKSLENGFTKEEHFAVSEQIKELFENSVYLTTETPRNNSADVKGYPKYIAKINANGKNAQAFLTIKELVEDGNRIYSLELQELVPLP